MTYNGGGRSSQRAKRSLKLNPVLFAHLIRKKLSADWVEGGERGAREHNGETSYYIVVPIQYIISKILYVGYLYRTRVFIISTAVCRTCPSRRIANDDGGGRCP